ncbi:hypothetical protein PF010_g9359 [Phytophthora fragariae]|uniref:RxLR effector protein n=1 Tax=Phytophthora fragariae TaxID=53985 RepID=A0A6A3TAR7_9STRA|nr:hypothetical protein PF003_g34891 [Phytophthora fragariae]KAE9115337.1 hypothetical protein PF007_g10061 [Phytophthora fragariae]KAE9115372.1 hypothetical protein PF010_g9359 [Phytophthora fragariae]KAE9126922.1 hypothetical protein PF006_g16613 [Phytophthora fragariae]
MKICIACILTSLISVFSGPKVMSQARPGLAPEHRRCHLTAAQQPSHLPTSVHV